MRTEICITLNGNTCTCDVEYSIIRESEAFASDLGTGYYYSMEIEIITVHSFYYLSDDGDIINLNSENYHDLIKEEIKTNF